MKKIIISKCSGRFANQLWMFANVLAFALEHDYKVAAPSFLNYADKFSYWNKSAFIKVPTDATAEPAVLSRKFDYYNNAIGLNHLANFKINIEALSLTSKVANKLKRLFSKNELPSRLYFEKEEYTEIVKSILTNNTVVLEGFMFCSSVLQMKKHREALREIFKPQFNVLQKMEWLNSQRKPDSVLIGVHIRRGDYSSYRDGKYFYDLDIYKMQIQHIQKLLADKNPVFFICSDEPFEQSFFNDFEVLENTNGNATEDLYLLSACDYLIAPPSTFSKWASYYGEVPLYVMEDANHLPEINEFEVRYNHYY